MWYKYFSKQSWNLRVWRQFSYQLISILRKANLFFNQDDIGMFKFKSVLRWKDMIFRLARHEGVVRGFNLVFLMGVLKSLAWVKGTYYDPTFVEPKQVEAQKELERLDAQADAVLFKNRFGAPSRPHRSLDDLIAFLAGSKTYEQLADFLSYDGAMNVSMDQQKGLDSWMSIQDRKMLKYYQRSIGRKTDLDEHGHGHGHEQSHEEEHHGH